MSQIENDTNLHKENETPLNVNKINDKKTNEYIRFYSHSLIFYFWPIWFFCLIFYALINLNINIPYITYGNIFTLVLFLTIFITTISIRGLWAILFATVIIIAFLLLKSYDMLGTIFRILTEINIEISNEFYLIFGIPLFIIWLLTVFVYDRRRYVRVYPHMIEIVREIGEGAKSFEVTGMTFQKKRDNFAMHWLLGFGSGDLLITTGVGSQKEIYIFNVLRVANKIKTMYKTLNN